MSNSDDKFESLDALYKRIQRDDNDSRSPPELDAKLRAAARAQSAPTGNSSPANSSPANTGLDETSRQSNSYSWQRRYGWATAATLLLTSALFLSLPDTSPSLTSATSGPRPAPTTRAPAPNTPNAPLAPALEQRSNNDQGSLSDQVAASPSLSISAPENLPAIERDLTAEMSELADVNEKARPDTQLTRKSSRPFSSALTESNASQLGSDVQVADAIPPDAQPKSIATNQTEQESAAAPQQETASETVQMRGHAIEEVVVTGRLRNTTKSCVSYKNLLISRVCREPALDQKARQKQDSDVPELSYTLHANRQSRCADQSFVLTTVDGAPEPQKDSTKSRFVLQPKSIDSSAQQPTEELVCKFGRLKLQSFARGR